jgi:hypothetical protein
MELIISKIIGYLIAVCMAAVAALTVGYIAIMILVSPV